MRYEGRRSRHAKGGRSPNAFRFAGMVSSRSSPNRSSIGQATFITQYQLAKKIYEITLDVTYGPRSDLISFDNDFFRSSVELWETLMEGCAEKNNIRPLPFCPNLGNL